jgi:excisionase family DNA binding protein
MDQILTKDEAAKFLKMSAKTIDYFITSGQIPFSRIGKRSVRFSTARLLRWMEEREGIPHKHQPHRRNDEK